MAWLACASATELNSYTYPLIIIISSLPNSNYTQTNQGLSGFITLSMCWMWNDLNCFISSLACLQSSAIFGCLVFHKSWTCLPNQLDTFGTKNKRRIEARVYIWTDLHTDKHWVSLDADILKAFVKSRLETKKESSILCNVVSSSPHTLAQIEEHTVVIWSTENSPSASFPRVSFGCTVKLDVTWILRGSSKLTLITIFEKKSIFVGRMVLLHFEVWDGASTDWKEQQGEEPCRSRRYYQS